ncbi:MAG: antitermination regulator [Actinomycetia bacterium]|nr:antitermination regulator [Actinomycetes bacterium]
MADPSRSEATLSAVIQSMARVLYDEHAVDSLLHLIVTFAPRSIAPTDAASVSLLREGPRFETANATSEEVIEIDRVQYSTQEGPCVTAIKTGEPYLYDAANPPEDWPNFTGVATSSGVVSVLSMPLILRERTLGALNLYSHLPGAAELWDRVTATEFVDHASVVLANAAAFADSARTARQLEEALQTRDVIGQAKGILMVRDGCDADEAFRRLRVISQRANRKLREIAVEVVESAGPPSPDDGQRPGPVRAE